MRYLAAVFLLISGAVQSASLPQSMGRDSRIKSVDYDPYDVVVMNVSVGTVSQIVFEQGEIITSVYSGFSQGFEFTPNANMLMIKPLTVQGVQPSEQWNTNLAVSTVKRNYAFDIRLTSNEDVDASYRIDFKYTIDDKKYRKIDYDNRVAESSRKDNEAIKKSLVVYETNYKFIQGPRSKAIVPQRVYNDERFTYIEFKTNSDLPTVLALDEDDNRSYPDVHVAKDNLSTLVVRQIAPGFLLVMGSKVVKIINGN